MECTLTDFDYRLYHIELRWYWHHALTSDAIFTRLPLRAMRVLSTIAAEKACHSFADLRAILPTDVLRYRGCGVKCRALIEKALHYNEVLEQRIDAMEYID